MTDLKTKMLGEALQYEATAASRACAAALFAPKYPKTTLSGFSKSKGVRKFKLGNTPITINDIDWIEVLAVIAGKTPKALVDKEWSVSHDERTGIVTIRSTRDSSKTAQISGKEFVRKLA